MNPKHWRAMPFLHLHPEPSDTGTATATAADMQQVQLRLLPSSPCGTSQRLSRKHPYLS